MFIADAHCDTLYKLAVDQIPLEECMVTPRRMQAGGVGLQTLAMFAGGKGCAGTPYADAVRMMEAAKALPFRVFTGRLPDEPPKEPAGVLSIEGGEVLEGSKTQYQHRFYYLEFIRSAGVKTAAEKDLQITNCPNCGAPTQVTSRGECEYCHSVITNGDFGWVLNQYMAW